MRNWQRLLLIGAGLLSIAPNAFAEHEEQSGDYYEEETPLRRPANPAANALGLLPNAPAETNLQTIREIQSSLRNADPKTLQALKQALTDIAQGREVNGQAGTVALDLLSRIPDAEVGADETSYEAEPGLDGPQPAAASGAPAQAAAPRQGTERFKGFGSAEGATGVSGVPGAVVLPAGTVVKLISGETPVSAPRGTTVVAAQRANVSVLSAFPYNGTSAEDESSADPTVSPEKKSVQKRVRAALPPAAGGGEALPTGEGGARLVPLGPPGGPLATLVMNTKRTIASTGGAAETTAAGSVGPDKQRLAGVVTSFLGRFRNRAHAEAGKSEARLGVFSRLAAGGGITAQQAMIKAAESPVYRRFQEATVEAGFSPTESLGAYYTVLVMAWVGTFGFVVYLTKETPWLKLALAPFRRKRKK